MNKIDKIKEEQKRLVEDVNEMDRKRQEIMLRLAEIQGVLKYLENNGENDKDSKK